MSLYEKVRTRRFLHPAWMQVRSSGLASASEKTRKAILGFEDNWINRINKIQKRLREEKFDFVAEQGHTPPKGKGKSGVRPIVVAPVANRIVRRAILDVLQGEDLDFEDRWQGVPAVIQIMSTPTSVGGIRSRGVPHGLALVDRAVATGNSSYIRSDIKNFFTRIPRQVVNDFVQASVDDRKFVDLFKRALETNLENQEELEERNLFKLFPDERIGVAQGSALSALAGNIVLNDFDLEMNSRGLTCIRYIDDFILLGPNEKSVRGGYTTARNILSAMGMDVYDLDDFAARKGGKVDAGNIFSGTDFLGYRISGRSRQPSSAACRKFVEKLNSIVAEAKKEMRETVRGTSSNPKLRYHQSMVKLHNFVWGWSQSFKHTTARHVFEQLDREIDGAMLQMSLEVGRLTDASQRDLRRRILGIHLLADTPNVGLPDLREEPTTEIHASALKAVNK